MRLLRFSAASGRRLFSFLFLFSFHLLGGMASEAPGGAPAIGTYADATDDLQLLATTSAAVTAAAQGSPDSEINCSSSIGEDNSVEHSSLTLCLPDLRTLLNSPPEASLPLLPTLSG